ncbi:MAG: DUF348 domain-containing protein [Candidatus Moraniibacteriota bacterium]|nr:MAG: DUF348 domain-containing protein [Candidatus Moranbacteria bacterium]
MRTILLLLGLVVGSWWLFHTFFDSGDAALLSQQTKLKTITLTVNQELVGVFATDRSTVGEFLRSLGYTLHERDQILPERETPLLTGMTVAFYPARPVTLKIDGKSEVLYTAADTAEAILRDQGVVLDEDDIVEPAREVVVAAQAMLQVTRVEIREEYKDTAIDYTTAVTEDSKLSWRTQQVTQKGEKGTKRTTYRVSYHDGKEVRRKVVSTETLKEPVPEKITQGTYVKLGKSHRGAASWYAWTGTMAAANPWLPKGSYVKVTNLDNGKSVIVVINDRGPFVPGRIIDLDKVAFAKIASIGAGVINVKMEEIVN